jgi:hypothetical protein
MGAEPHGNIADREGLQRRDGITINKARKLTSREASDTIEV